MDVFKTGDLGLAAFLRTEGYHPNGFELVSVKPKKAVWIFPNSSRLQECFADYQDGEADVDPKEFTKTLGTVRGELYDFLRTVAAAPR